MKRDVNINSSSISLTATRVKFLQDYQIKDMETLNEILEKDPVSFTNVRHPFERLVSGYLHFRDLYNELKGKTFDQFVTETVLLQASQNKTSFRKMNPHWRQGMTDSGFFSDSDSRHIFSDSIDSNR